MENTNLNYMLSRLGRISVHPWFISALNLCFFFILFNSVLDIFLTHASPYKEAEDIIEGVGVILIAWGVALEERNKLREVFGLLHQDGSDNALYEAALDENCHRYGLGLLLLGLFSEVGVECVRIPDRIIDTTSIENNVLLASACLQVVAGALMLRQVAYLLFISKKSVVSSAVKGKSN